MNDEWICKEMGREFSLLFWSASQLPLFILNFIKKFSTLLRLAEKVVVQLRRGEKGKAQQDDDNAVSLSSLPPPLSSLHSEADPTTAAVEQPSGARELRK